MATPLITTSLYFPFSVVHMHIGTPLITKSSLILLVNISGSSAVASVTSLYFPFSEVSMLQMVTSVAFQTCVKFLAALLKLKPS